MKIIVLFCRCSVSPDYYVITPITTAEYVYEFIDFAASEFSEVYLHFDVNVCYKGVDSGGHCNVSCSTDNGATDSDIGRPENYILAISPPITPMRTEDLATPGSASELNRQSVIVMMVIVTFQQLFTFI